MIEASLRPDGSVADVVRRSPTPAGPVETPEGSLFALDGLPQGIEVAPLSDVNRDVADPGRPGSWTGGFSFAHWDRAASTLRAFRDQYGSRPLYYHPAPGRLLLSADLPSILRSLPSTPPLDEVSVIDYLATGAIPEGRTFHEGIHRLGAAGKITADRDGLRVERYWRPWTGPWNGSLDARELDARFRLLFRQAVARTLSGSRPVGVLLSGGPDSSVVLGMACRVAREDPGAPGAPKAALTLAFDELSQCDERPRARETAALHGVPWRDVAVERHSPLLGFDEFLASFGEPPCSSNLAIDSLLLQAAKGEGIEVLLDGHDADALFTPSATYLAHLARHLRWGRLADELRGLRRHHRLPLRRLARACAAPLAPVWVRGLRRRAPVWLDRRAVRRTGLEDRLRPVAAAGGAEEDQARRALAPSVGLALEAARCLERMHGVEGRHPFFDPELVRFVLSLPVEARFRHGESKALMRRSLSDLLTPAISARIDKTNYTPYFEWSLRTHLRAGIERLSESASSELDPYVDRTRVRPLLRAFLAGERAGAAAIWRMIVLERWLVLQSGTIQGRFAS